MSQKIRIIFLSAKILLNKLHPLYSTFQIDANKFAELHESLKKRGIRDTFEFVDIVNSHDTVVDLTLAQLQKRFENNAPVVHFCGYAKDKPLDIKHELPQPLSNIFKIKGKNIRCVLLIACHSQKQADAMSHHVDCVIGLPREMPYEQATEFIVSFYAALSQKMNLNDAIEWGRIPISEHLEGIPLEHHPKIIHPKEPDLSKIVILEDEDQKGKVQEEFITTAQKLLMEWATLAINNKAT